MVLQTINENKAWIQMTWKCAYVMQWPNILFVANKMLGTFENPEVLIGNKGGGGARVNPAERQEKKEMLVLRGYSTHFKGNLSITFHTETSDVTVNIPKSLGLPTDYESLAKAVGPYMDSVELRMYAAK